MPLESCPLPGLPVALTEDDAAAILRVYLAAATRRKTLAFNIGPVLEQRLSPAEGVIPSMVTLTDTQQSQLSIAVTDRKGAPAAVDGAPQWASSDAAVCAVVASEDGMSATIVAGMPGTAQVSVNADADLGEGVIALQGLLDVMVVASQAVGIAISAGTPAEQPQA